jgi:hypothetical protein
LFKRPAAQSWRIVCRRRCYPELVHTHFWRKNFFKTLKDVGEEASMSPEWEDYALFCSEYERGLRQQAFTTLGRFMQTLERAPFEERRRFVSWLLNRADRYDGGHMLAPHPLRIRVIEPTLLEWTLAEPSCSEPHRWLEGYAHLKQAVELEPNDDIARRKLLGLILGRVRMSTHELPLGYLGNVQDDLAALREAENLIAGFSNHEDRDRFTTDIAEQLERIQNYLRGNGR